MLGTNSRRSRLRTTVALATGLAAVAAYALAFAPTTANASPSTAAPKVTYVTINGVAKHVKTSKGPKVTVSVYAGRDTLADSKTTGLTVALENASQSHYWNFQIPSSAVKAASSGKASVKPSAKKLAPFGKVSLTAKPKGKPKTISCKGSPSTKTQKVTLGGTFYFDTRSGKHGWGTVGSKKKAFHFSTSATVTWSYANDNYCYSGGSICLSSTTWAAYTSGKSLGGDVRKHPRINGTRDARLTKPKGATRNDYVTAALKSAKLSTSNGGADAKLVLTGTGGASSGSATVTGTGASTDAYPCGKGGKKQKSSYWNGSFKNGSKPLTVRDIYGAIKLPSNVDATINKYAVVS